MPSLSELLRIERGLQKDGIAPRGTLHLHNVRTRFTLDQDLGNEPSPLMSYDLDEDTRDRLIVHARQDSSLAVYAAHASERLGIINRRLLIVILLVQCVIAWHIW